MEEAASVVIMDAEEDDVSGSSFHGVMDSVRHFFFVPPFIYDYIAYAARRKKSNHGQA